MAESDDTGANSPSTSSGEKSNGTGRLATDLVMPMAIRVAATLRIADLLANGPVDGPELAEKSRSDPDALIRLLRYLVARGIFVEPRPAMFGLNDAASVLRSDHPSGMVRHLDLDDLPVALAFTGLLHTVRTGEPAFPEVFGTPFWSYLSANPRAGASFDKAMADDTVFKADAAAGYDWSDVGHVVDVGGGSGALLAEILQLNPSIRGTLVERPDPLARGREYLSSKGLADRCSLVGQSFFDPLPRDGDVYILCSILADWPEPEALEIIRRCAEAMGSSGRLLVIEHPSTDQQQFTHMDLLMLVLVAGKSRTPDENVALLARAGLRATSTVRTSRGHVIIECVKP